MKKKINILFVLVFLLVLWCAWLSYRVYQLQHDAKINEWHTRQLYKAE